MTTHPYYGESPCMGKTKAGADCRYKAYVRCKIKGKYSYFCNIHGKAHSTKPLIKNPRGKEDVIAREQELAQEAQKRNKKKGLPGKVIMRKMRMMKDCPAEPGFIKVFPNYRHGSRKDGMGLPSLSPMTLGPIKHQRPGVPKAKLLENFWQGSKCFASEKVKLGEGPKETSYQTSDLDRSFEKKNKKKYDPDRDFFKTQKAWFKDDEPHRHKVKGEPPLFWVWVDSDNVAHKLSYVEARQFYCKYFERLTRKNEDLKRLREMIAEGWNLQICGYDAQDLDSPDDKELRRMYKDPDHPFGHEVVIYTLLTSEHEYPWDRYRTYDF